MLGKSFKAVKDITNVTIAIRVFSIRYFTMPGTYIEDLILVS